MAVIAIGKIEREIKDTWETVTLEDAIKLGELELPKKLKAFYDHQYGDSDKEVKFTQVDQNSHFPKYYKKVLELLTPDITTQELNGLSIDDRLLLYNEILEPIVVGVHYEGCTYKVGDLKKFDHKGVEYVLPESVMLFGKERPMFDEPFIGWSETDDLIKAAYEMKEGYLSAAKHVVSIMARPKDEVYDEAVSLKRSDEFLTLPMSIVWEVFFCTQKQLVIFSRHSALKAAQKVKSNSTLKEQVESARLVGTAI